MNNISAVRYLLALSVVIAHVGELMGFAVHWPIPSYIAVGGFFSLSGYLVFASYERRPALFDFLRSRARRIMPSYILIVLLCAVFLFPVSSFEPETYFTSSKWWSYVTANLCFLNFLQPTLPGIFENHLHMAVNGSLWTMKIEWMLYLSIPIVVWISHRWNLKRTRMTIAIYILSVAYRILFVKLFEQTENEIYLMLSRQFFGQLAFFYTGVWIYFRFDLFKTYRHQIAIIALILLLVKGYIPYYSYILEPAVISLLVIYACTTGHWGTWIPRKGNCSYEIYLSHFPIIQLGIHFGLPSLGFWPSFIVVILVTSIFSYLLLRVTSNK